MGNHGHADSSTVGVQMVRCACRGSLASSLLLGILLLASGIPAVDAVAAPGSSQPICSNSRRPDLRPRAGSPLEANGRSFQPTTSLEGRHVAFASDASNLVEGDTNQARDIFVRDRINNTTTRVSVAATGAQANGSSSGASISSDGRFVAFRSDASNLVTGDTNGVSDIFVFDQQDGSIYRISRASSGEQANAASQSPTISGDGLRVIFQSTATNLVTSDTNGVRDVFVRNREDATTTRVSVTPSGGQANGASSAPAISLDGRVRVFSSTATNLVPSDTNNVADIFLRIPGDTMRISKDSLEGQANGASVEPVVSAEGDYVAFTSEASNLVGSDGNGASDVFLRERDTGQTILVSADQFGNEGNASSSAPSIDGGGRYVVFQSAATNISGGGGDSITDVFEFDRVMKWNALISIDETIRGNGNSTAPVIAAQGDHVVFESASSNFSDDTNFAFDVFVHFWTDKNHGQTGGATCIVNKVSRQDREAEEPVPVPIPIEPPFGDDNPPWDPQCQSPTPTQVAVPNTDPATYTVYDRFRDLNGNELPLRWGYYQPPDRGFGYRKIEGKHGWDSRVRSHITETLLGRTPLGAKPAEPRQPSDPEIAGGSSFLYFWYYFDEFTGAKCTRKVVVDERLLDDGAAFGIVTSFAYQGWYRR